VAGPESTTGSSTDGAGASVERLQERHHQITFGAERFADRTRGEGHDWERMEDQGATGGTCMVARPKNGTNVGNNTTGPRLDYDIEFANAGIYYVWVRLKGVDDTSDSLHVGLDGELRTDAGNGLGNGSGEWRWVGQSGPERVFLEVPSPGQYTVNVWMREDGVRIDQIELTVGRASQPDRKPGPGSDYRV
jgi:hypothetical protein